MYTSGLLKVCGRGTYGIMIYIFKNILIGFMYSVLILVISLLMLLEIVCGKHI